MAGAETLYHASLGYSTQRPTVMLPAIDRRALMQNAHCIAARVRSHMANQTSNRNPIERHQFAHSKRQQFDCGFAQSTTPGVQSNRRTD
jgi:hypothetical protein